MPPIVGTSASRGCASLVQPELGDLLVSYLRQLSVDYVFGVPGGAIEPLYNALARSERCGGPRSVVARHETGAAFMADGYARQTGKLAVCCSTTGPGATNLITGVASAFENRIPMLVITAQTALANFGRGALQESSCTGVNTVGMFQYCTRYNTFVSHVEQFERKLAAAIMSAYQAPAGPAHLSIPLDLLRSAAPNPSPAFELSALLHQPSLLDDGAVSELCQRLDRAKRTVFLIGEGCGEAIGTILDVALLLDARIVTTPHGKGLVSPFHPLFRGVIGFAGHASAHEALTDPEVDTVVAIGTALGEWASDGWDSVLLNRRMIHVDATEGNLTRSPMAGLHVRGRIQTIFDRVHAHVRKRPSRSIPDEVRAETGSAIRASTSGDADTQWHFSLDDEDSYRSESAPIKPPRLMRELTRLFPPNTRYLADSGNSVAWAVHYLHPFDRRVSGRRNAKGGLFRGALEFASMGWAIGAAVGTALGYRESPVVCITGDGSWLMSGQEITVALQEKLTVVFVILNDSALGMVKHGQRLAKAEPTGYELPKIDYAGIAEAMGISAHRIQTAEELSALDIGEIVQRCGPTVLDVRIDGEAVPPMRSRLKVLGTVQ